MTTATNRTAIDIAADVRNLKDAARSFWVGRDDFIDLVATSFVAGEHGIVFGRVGTAKSEIVDAMSRALHLRYYFTQGSPDLTLDELIGMQSYAALRNDQFDRVWVNLADSEIVFFDEFGKAPGEVQNLVLSAMQERKVRAKGSGRPIPLHVMWSASNEPIESEAANDRFLFRHIVKPISEIDSFNALLRTPRKRQSGTVQLPQTPLTYHDLATMRNAVLDMETETSDGFRTAMAELWAQVRTQLPDLYVSDRRWIKLQRAACASALLAGREHVSRYDLRIAKHVLWLHPDPAAIPVLDQVVDNIAMQGTAEYSRAHESLEEIRRLFEEAKTTWQDDTQSDDEKISTHGQLGNAIASLARYIRSKKSANPDLDWSSMQREVTYLKNQAADLLKTYS